MKVKLFRVGEIERALPANKRKRKYREIPEVKAKLDILCCSELRYVYFTTNTYMIVSAECSYGIYKSCKTSIDCSMHMVVVLPGE